MNNNGFNNIFMNNNIGMNPMFINNMMGMNNAQQNIMDENALRIKNIIQPYENKIKQLEEIIRQKDFEITILKDKLNNNGRIEYKGNEITVIYDNCYKTKYNCFEKEITYKLLERMYGPYWNLVKFSSNEKLLNPFITIENNLVINGNIISLNSFKNIVFKGNYGNICVSLDDNYYFKKAVKYFLLKLGKEGCYDMFYFIYNAKSLNIECKSPVKEIFNFGNNIVYYKEIGI